MSCNGCRILRKGCSESCVLRPCLQWIDSAEAQGHATVFVAKFFGRAGLISFISAVPESQRTGDLTPALFQSLLFEACGRTINPVNGAVGLLWTGNWHLCQAAVETVLRGGTLRPVPDLDAVELANGAPDKAGCSYFSSAMKRRGILDGGSVDGSPQLCDLDLCLTPRLPSVARELKRRPTTPSEASVTTSDESGVDQTAPGQPRLLNLFV